MYIISSTYEKAKFADILRHVEQEQKKRENLPEEVLFASKSCRSAEGFWNLWLGLLALFTSPFLR